MSSSDRGRDDAPGTQREPAPPTGTPTGGADAYRETGWIACKRARARQGCPSPATFTPGRTTRNWADQVRDSWKATDSTGASLPGKPKK